MVLALVIEKSVCTKILPLSNSVTSHAVIDEAIGGLLGY